MSRLEEDIQAVAKVQKLYETKSFSPAVNDNIGRLLARIVELEEAVRALPKTADGMPITPGMDAWCIRTARWKWIGEKGTPSYRGIEDYTEYPDPIEVMVAYIGALGSPLQRLGILRHGMSFTEMSLPEFLFSTRAAALAAARGNAEGGEERKS